MVKKVKNIVLRTYFISDRNGEEIFGPFCKKELRKKTNQNEFRIEKSIKGKNGKL